MLYIGRRSRFVEIMLYIGRRSRFVEIRNSLFLFINCVPVLHCIVMCLRLVHTLIGCGFCCISMVTPVVTMHSTYIGTTNNSMDLMHACHAANKKSTAFIQHEHNQ